MRVVEHKFRPTIGAVFASLEAGIKFYEVYARARGFTPRKHSTKTLQGGVAHQKFVVCNRQGFRESKPKQRPRTKDDENMGDGSSLTSTITRRVKITRIGCRAYVGFALLHGLDGPAMIDELYEKTLILDNSKLNIGAGLTFRQVKELVNGYENIGATLIDFKNFQRDIKCYIGLRDADLFIDRLEKLKATQPQFYFAYDVEPQNRLTKFFWADATCIRNYSFFGDAVSFDPTYRTNKYDMVFTPFTGSKSAMDQTALYTKVFQKEVMAADSCGVDDFEKEEHVRIIHAYSVGVQGQRNWANTKQVHCRSLAK
ncbi:protein FAR1-RELATED SEQUENCE 5-like [Silene latifolia]|uniref:protein FAR1-RELATED SEQUENCE 5-like n=1 Tax=Silene latifolia TaxID=37657 RepID=UPI003D776160